MVAELGMLILVKCDNRSVQTEYSCVKLLCSNAALHVLLCNLITSCVIGLWRLERELISSDLPFLTFCTNTIFDIVLYVNVSLWKPNDICIRSSLVFVCVCAFSVSAWFAFRCTLCPVQSV